MTLTLVTRVTPAAAAAAAAAVAVPGHDPAGPSLDLWVSLRAGVPDLSGRSSSPASRGAPPTHSGGSWCPFRVARYSHPLWCLSHQTWNWAMSTQPACFVPD